MTTLIEFSNGKSHRRCDAKCYNAKGDRCVCVCDGVNHGAGLSKAKANTDVFAEDWIEAYKREHPEEEDVKVFVAPYQLPMFLEF